MSSGTFNNMKQAPAASQQNSNFLGLPTEIRCMIYAHYFAGKTVAYRAPSPAPTSSSLSLNSEDTTTAAAESLLKRSALNILGVCRQVRREATPAFQEHATVAYNAAVHAGLPHERSGVFEASKLKRVTLEVECLRCRGANSDACALGGHVVSSPSPLMLPSFSQGLGFALLRQGRQANNLCSTVPTPPDACSQAGVS
jgi:hypothetical protein